MANGRDFVSKHLLSYSWVLMALKVERANGKVSFRFNTVHCYPLRVFWGQLQPSYVRNEPLATLRLRRFVL